MLHRMFAADPFLASCRSWIHFRKAAAALPPARRRDAFVRLTELLLKTAPVFRNVLDPEAIWPIDALPSAIRSDLGLPPGSADLVARRRDGDYWAVRADSTAEGGRPPSVKEVAAFGKAVFRRGGRSRPQVVHALIAHHAEEDIAGAGARIGQIGLADWQGLGQAGWKRIVAAAKGRPIKPPKPKKPKPHQLAAIADALKHFRGHARGRLVMPCGTGKSLTGTLIAEALGAKTIIVAAPSLSLIRQNLAGWAEDFDAKGRTFDCICVCSDDTVTGNRGADRDEIAETASGLGIEVTTDAGEIAAYLKRPRKRPLVVFVTYHSSPLLVEAVEDAEVGFDLAILDEAHKTVGTVDRAFAALLDGERIEIRKRLSMTATERVYRGERDDVLSMDSEKDYGKCFHSLSFKAAIEQKLICDYRIVTFFVRESEIREMIESGALIDVDHEGEAAFSEADAMALAAGIALKGVVRDHAVRHIISFHRSIAAAEKFSLQQDRLDRFPKLGRPLVNLHVSGKMPTSVRSGIMERFAASEAGLVSNARCLTEGVDVPRTDCILFEGPKQSVIDIAQAAGRAMRLFPGKEFGYVVVPVVVPDGMDFEAFASTTAFRKVAQTLTALSTQDERLAVEFRDKVEWKPGDGGGIVSVEGDAFGQVEFDELVKAIRTKVWRTMARANWRPFEEARAYARGLGLTNSAEWRRCGETGDIPADVPRHPDTVYRDWAGWGDWLGTGRTVSEKWRASWNGKKIRSRSKTDVRPFEQARAFARGLGLRNTREWKAAVRSEKMPKDIPNAVDRVYAGKGWAGWGDWLGTGNVADKNKVRRPFPEARAYVHTLGLDTKGWREFVKSGRKPADIPSRPDVAYAGKGFTTYGDWLGTRRKGET